MSDMKGTIHLLTHWGKWVRMGQGIPRCATQMETILRDVEPHQDDEPLCITDDDALMIDSIVAHLQHRDAEMGSVLSLYYRSHDHSMRAISRQLNLHRSRVERLLSSAEAWVDGVLEARQMMAA